MLTSPRFLAIQPDELFPLGLLDIWLRDAGVELEVCRPLAQELPKDLQDYQGVICLGGRMSATDKGGHPWIADIHRLMSRAVSTSLPILGIGLGAQLLAVATGGRVEPNEHGPEVGPSLVSKKDAAWIDPLFAEVPLLQDVVQFHREGITRLPSQGVLLASSPRCPIEAFRVGKVAYGIQFHLETTTEIISSWLEADPKLSEWARAEAFAASTLAKVHADIAETWQPVVRKFVELATGQLAAADERRPGLPMLD